MDERVLAIPRDALFEGGRSFTGFSPVGRFDFTERILANHRYLFRKTAGADQELPVEEDPRFKQVIPYCLFVNGGRLFMYERLRKGGEERLHDLYLIGVGGHINPIDAGHDLLERAMLREFHEELSYSGAFRWELLGFINMDDAEPVHKVHFGMVYLLRGDSPAIAVREVDTLSGRLVPFEEALSSKGKMERWSRACVDYLRENPHIIREVKR